MTPTQEKALKFIRDNPGVQAAKIAEHLWPDSLMHRRQYNTGNGACVGKGAWLCGGSYVGKLIKKGWVWRDYDKWRDYDTGEVTYGAALYKISRVGLAALNKTIGARGD